MALPKAIAAKKFAVVVATVACAGLVVIFLLATTSTTSVDRFGVKHIYSTKPGGKEWYLNATDFSDGFVISSAAAEVLPIPEGSWQIGRETASPNTGLHMYVISDAWQSVR